jgi:CheY-like chemotaxis protein
VNGVAAEPCPPVRQVLVVEDEYFLASMLALSLELDGFRVLGPAGSVPQALALLEKHRSVDCAVLDLNLRGETSYAVADTLLERRVPFMFLTGYARQVLPEKYADVPLRQKPVEGSQLAQLLHELLDGTAGGGAPRAVAPDHVVPPERPPPDRALRTSLT